MKHYGVIMAGGGGTPFLAVEPSGNAEADAESKRQRSDDQ